MKEQILNVELPEVEQQGISIWLNGIPDRSGRTAQPQMVSDGMISYASDPQSAAGRLHSRTDRT